jgi:hypothetical protein
MAEDTISKPRAKRIRLLSQAAALCCVVAAVAAVLFGIPLLRGSSVTTVAWDDVDNSANEMYRDIVARRAEQQSGGDNALPPDREYIAGNLSMISNKPVVKQPEPPKTAGAGPGDSTGTGSGPAAAAEAKTRFVGTVGIGNRLMALVTAGGSQRIMGEGDEAVLPLQDGASGEPPKVSIKSVTPDEVVIVENGTEHTIEKAQRTGFAVSTSVASVAPAPASDGPTTGRTSGRTAGAMQADEVKPVNPDDFRRDDGTIDYEALREAARERARQRQELRRQQREENGDAN